MPVKYKKRLDTNSRADQQKQSSLSPAHREELKICIACGTNDILSLSVEQDNDCILSLKGALLPRDDTVQQVMDVVQYGQKLAKSPPLCHRC